MESIRRFKFIEVFGLFPGSVSHVSFLEHLKYSPPQENFLDPRIDSDDLNFGSRNPKHVVLIGIPQMTVSNFLNL